MATLQSMWKKYSPLFHVMAWIFFAGMMWANVSAYDGRIKALEVDNVASGKSLVRIEQKVDDIKDALNIKHR